LRGNPYSGNGGGNGQGNGRGNGNGQGNGQPYVPPALRHDNDRNRGKGTKGLTVTPPPTDSGAPGANLPNLDESRKVRTSPSTSATSSTIHADLMCADCDSSGGGGAGGSYPNDPYLATARTRPVNVTGDPGVNLGSRNFNWGLPIVSLLGRAGLDLSIALYYNSLVWTRQGNTVEYNADHGTPAPGFQLGFPRIQPRYFDSDDSVNAYIMVMPSGGRVEMKQVGTSSVYESADSTYTQFTPYTDGSGGIAYTT